MPTSYRLEIIVRQLHSLTASIKAKLASPYLVIQFLDFPAITIRPTEPNFLAYTEKVVFNVNHRAEFQLGEGEEEKLFPAKCNCQLRSIDLDDSIVFSVPCPLVTETPASVSRFPCSDYSMISLNGQTVGFAELAARVVRVGDVADAGTENVSDAALVDRRDVPNTVVEKPYIIRVVVNKERKPSSGFTNALTTKRSDVLSGSGRAGSVKDEVKPVTTSWPDDRAVSKAERKSLLFLLEYSVSCQLMSFSETLSALIRREYKRLNSVGCGKRSKSLRASISRGIERITRVANIVLQVANQLIENSEDPEVLGVARKISDNEKIRKNPVNKLPTIEDGSVNYFLAYEVLFQLQMLGTNISYIVSAYRKALEIPLKDLPDQHVAFCRELCDEVQGVTKEVNVLVQSAIDGRYKKDGSPRKTRHSRKHRSTRKTRSSSESSSDSDSSSTSSSSPLARSRRRSSVSSDDSDASSGSSSTDSSKSTPVRRKKSGYSDDFSSSSSSGSSSSTSSSSSRSLNSYKVSPKRTTLLDPVPRVVSTGILTPTPVSPLPVSPHSTPQQALSVPQVPITPTLSGGGFGLSNPSLTPPAPNLGSSLPLAVPLPTASPMHNQPAPQLSLNTSLPLNTPPPPPNDNNNPTSTYNLLSTFHFGGSSSSSPSGSRQPSLVPAPQPPTSSSFGLPAVPPPLSPTAVQTSAVYNNDI